VSDYVTRRKAGEQALWQHGTPLLGRIDIELTERCDNDCVHCCIALPEGDAEAELREMSTAEVRAVLTAAAALGALSVRFTGGEPLLRGDFPELYLCARRLGLKVMLFTNARGVTPELADLLARVPPLELVEVSVYGMSERTYEAATRRRGSYSEFRRGVELLLDRGVPFVVKGALLPGLAGEVAEFEAWAATLPAMTKPPAYSMFFDLRGRRECGGSAAGATPATGVPAPCDLEARNETIRRVRLAPAAGVAFLARDRERYMQGMREFCTRFMRPPGDVLFSCGAGHGACVDAYGDVQPCLPMRAPETTVSLRVEAGGGGEGGTPGGPAAAPAAFDPARLRYALTEAFPRLRETKATDPEYLRRCAVCFLKGLCEQCPAKSWAESGTLDTPVEYLCEVAHEQARDLGLLEPGERAWEIVDWKARVERI
jgi:pyruvate-formate lyase-activating enzyme